jgi:hypothetical protein
MKKILLFAACLTASTALLAQTNTLPATGNVGVGTLSPTAKLEVYDGHIKVSNNTSPATLILAGDRGNSGDAGEIDTRIFFQTDNDPNEGWSFDGLNFASSSQMQFNYNHSGTAKSVMALGDGTAAGQGKIGIGTSAPGVGTGVDTKLHIYGSGTNASGRTEVRVENSSATAAARIGVLNSSGGGIGIESFGTDYVGALAGMQAVHATGSLIFIGSNLGPSGGTGTISFRPGGYDTSSETVRFTPNGLVGIGTTTPTEKLSVNGNIRAKEIKVETQNWPDYVFSSSYKSRSLAELEQFIKLNSHLPEIPSADEVQSEGIAVGEMNAKLLKKIEELTLYLIEMDKKIIRLENRNVELRQTLGKRD